MYLLIECVIFCLLMFLICFFSTGSDEKNIKSFASYPKEVQDKLRENEKYKNLIKESNWIISFISNFIIFGILTFIFGLFIRTTNFLTNFLNLLILGEVLNLFDLLVIDLLWWRNSKRIRFSEIPEKELYLSPRNHLISFLKAVPMFAIIALINGAILMLF